MVKTTDKPRNIAILNDYKELGTLQRVGDKYGITRERVRQIVAMFGYEKPHKPKFSKGEKLAIRRNKRIEELFNNINKTDNDCWEWKGLRYPAGYGRFRWHGRNNYTHRVAWIVTNGNIPEGMHVCHHCDNPPCINPSHLFLGTVADNMHDRDQKGRNNKGKKYKNGKLVKIGCNKTDIVVI